ncbi:flavin monoamine oxidase family protein [Agromyces silvae]|uniref:flavin monoamine oxidase family protein n=1 Tax=Agromyces silvae TaxID=3388266 RepID=UPI00280B8E9B|nr:NAD(P)/FAD-dependent oxidoreductase [Agromyces protaetiae]
MKILIAGAGLSGLHSAWRLKEAGHEVVVFDARDRVGGRTYSTPLANGVIVDHGALTIRSEDHALRGLCAELEIEMIGIGFPVGRWEVGLDEHHTVDEVSWLYEALGARAHARIANGDGDESLDAAFEAVVGQDYRTHPTYLNTTAALSVPLDRLSANGFVAQYFGSVWGSDEHAEDGAFDPGIVEHASRIHGGNQRPATELARRLGDAVRLGSPVVNVTQDADSVTFELADGSTVHGDGAIIALPLPLLRELKLGFALPLQMRRAIDTLVMGASAMANFALETPGRPECAAEPTEWWTACTWASASNELASESAVTAFFGTDPVIDRVLEGGPEVAQARVSAVLPGCTFPEAPDIVITDWRTEEWSRGSYPNWGVGWDPEMNEAFAQRVVGRVAISGADTSGAFVGGMEGAVKTGRIAATQLLEKLTP